MLTISFSLAVDLEVLEVSLCSMGQTSASFETRDTSRCTSRIVMKQEVDHYPSRFLRVERYTAVLLVVVSSVGVISTAFVVVEFCFPSNLPRSVRHISLAS